MKNKIRLSSNWIAVIIFTFITIAFVFPMFKNFDYWGVGDWDQHFFYNAAPRKTILEFHQFPLWNPYYCGGNVALAHPESPFLSPFFIFVLLFGTVAGLKIGLIVHIIIGMFGMYLLSKHLGMAKYASFLPAIIYMMSSWFPLRMNAGHTLFFSAAFLPYIFLFFLKSYEKKKYMFLTSIFLVLMVFSGGTYPFLFTLIFMGFYSVLDSFNKKKIIPVKNLVFILIITFLLGSIKFLPTMEFVNDVAFTRDDPQPNSLNILYNSLLSRNQSITSRIYTVTYDNKIYGIDEIIWAWHEYGAYLGIIPLMLFLASFYLFFKKRWVLLITSLFFLFMSMGEFIPLNLWRILRLLPVFRTLHGPSRFMFIFIFTLAIIAGFALSKIEKLKYKKLAKYKDYIVLGIIIIVLIDLFLVSSPIFGKIFLVEPPRINTEMPQLIQFSSTKPTTTTYRNFLHNIGTVNCYERLLPEMKAIPYGRDDGIEYNNYIGEAYIASTNRTVPITRFTPNKITLETDVIRESTVVLNQNYYNGWKVKDGKAFSYNGLIAAKTNPLKRYVKFYYRPNTFIFGSIITIVTLLGIILYFKHGKKHKQG